MSKKDKPQEERDKEDFIERAQELADVKAILETPSGVRFFRRFMRDGYIFRSTFTGNSNGYFLEGGRALALKYFSDLCEVAPEKVPEIMIEKQED